MYLLGFAEGPLPCFTSAGPLVGLAALLDFLSCSTKVEPTSSLLCRYCAQRRCTIQTYIFMG